MCVNRRHQLADQCEKWEILLIVALTPTFVRFRSSQLRCRSNGWETLTTSSTRERERMLARLVLLQCSETEPIKWHYEGEQKWRMKMSFGSRVWPTDLTRGEQKRHVDNLFLHLSRSFSFPFPKPAVTTFANVIESTEAKGAKHLRSAMSESIRIDVPRRDQLFPRPRFKRITSIVSSCPPVLQETTVVRPPIENQEKEPSTDRAELIAHRFTTIRRLGIGGFGEVSWDMHQGDEVDRF